MNGDFSGLVDPARKEPSVIALNSYVPRLAPGRYRAAAVARKMIVTQRAGYSTAVYADPPQYAVAPTVEFEVVAASAQWVSDRQSRAASRR